MYFPGDEVIRTKYGTGMVGKLIHPMCEDSWIVEVMSVPRRIDSYLRVAVGKKEQWSSAYFALLRAGKRKAEWEV